MKTLIVYYSRSDHTEEVAERIHDLVRGDMISLEPIKSYPEDYQQLTQTAGEEIQKNVRVDYHALDLSPSDYDLIFIGTPNWWGECAGVVKSFLNDYDLSAKRIAVFVTHKGGGLGHIMNTISQLSGSRQVLYPFSCYGGQYSNSELTAWVNNSLKG